MSKAAFDIVQKARSNARQTGLDYIHSIVPDFIELHGDRRYGDDASIVGGIGTLDGLPVTVIAIEKGHSAKERAMRNFGSPHPEGYRKALRLMKQAEKFHRPVICLVDTSGAYCGIGAEERGQGQAIAENLMEMMTLNTPIVSIVIGEGGSGGALALAVADRVWMLQSAIYSVISPEGCASILWKNAKLAAEAAGCLHLTAEDAYRYGIIEEIIREDGRTTEELNAFIKQRLSDTIRKLRAEPELTEKRYARFRRIGAEPAALPELTEPQEEIDI
ncbi:MAG: acetyl-CoA carboxylase carboxyl transferase subunit alpha [Oscillospiraceae bacterium]|nr:acetyl-CoA carboxylase carboxyl transferase subunit alpha [Oscillospiraceae bacterium]